MSNELQNRTVLIVGRGSGIARSVALAAGNAGARVVVASRDRNALAAAYEGTAMHIERVDLTDEASIVALADHVGSVDHVVSAASARARGRVADLDPAAVLDSFHTKVVGPMMLAKHFAPKMPTDGSFVFFSGASARKAALGMLAVAATNGAVEVLARSLAVDIAPIRVNAIAPGTIDTGAYDGLGAAVKAELYAKRAELNPAQRMGQSDDIASAVLLALTNTFLTGTTLVVDGGETLV
jgi:NAD(P)-dependent dehydrogenase (short-subunit alcohol dehydrogenase family)